MENHTGDNSYRTRRFKNRCFLSALNVELNTEAHQNEVVQYTEHLLDSWSPHNYHPQYIPGDVMNTTTFKLNVIY